MTLVIDGHNLIGVMPGMSLADPDDEWQLVVRLRRFADAERRTLTVVFDSGAGPIIDQHLSGGRITVRFAPPGVEADAVILDMLRSSRPPGQVTVVTNDQGLAGQVRAAGGEVRSATQFARALAPAQAKVQASSEPEHRPLDPAFADLYHEFVEAERSKARFGADIDLDVAVWIERLYGNDVQEAARAARWLGRFGGARAVEPLLDALTHSAGQVRAAAILALANAQAKGAVADIAVHLATDPSSMVREAAAQALGRLGGPQAETALQQALSDPKSKVRKSAAAGLQQLHARR